jgi:hypothetical protein
VTAQSLMERINSAASVSFLKSLQEYLLQNRLSEWISEFPSDLLAQFSKILIQDSSVFELHEKLQKQFKGSGGRASKSCAKIDVIYDLKTKQYEQILLTDQSEADQKLGLAIEKYLTEKSIVIRDLGYLRVDSLKEIINRSAHFLSRFRSSHLVYLNVQDETPLDLAAYLKKKCKNQKVVDLDIYMTNEKLPVRLVAYKAPQWVVDQRKREAHKTAKKQGRTLQEKTLILMSYTIFITNVPSNIWKPEVIGTIYRIRWQIELLFKSWKTGMNIHYLKGINENRIRTLVYARLILMILVNEFYKLADFLCPSNREISMQKVFNWIRDNERLTRILKGRLGWSEERYFIDTIQKTMCKQKRKRKTSYEGILEGISFGYNGA